MIKILLSYPYSSTFVEDVVLQEIDRTQKLPVFANIKHISDELSVYFVKQVDEN